MTDLKPTADKRAPQVPIVRSACGCASQGENVISRCNRLGHNPHAALVNTKRARAESPGDQCARCTHTRGVHGKQFRDDGKPGCAYCGTYCESFVPYEKGTK